MRFEESSAYPEENAFDYRVEWDDRVTMTFGGSDVNFEHAGSGSEFFTDYDQAWDRFCDCRDSPDYRGLKLIRIAPDGTETVDRSA